MPTPISLKTSDGRFAYEVAGRSELTPLIFLHGIGCAARGWRRQLDAFSDRYRAVAWDMPGYGGSAPLVRVSIAALADSLQDFLQQIGATRTAPILVGHSIGGMIVQQWLVKHPASAAAVVLAQTSPAFGNSGGDWQKSFLEARLGPLDRGETLASLAPMLVGKLVGDDPDAAGLDIARDCMARVPDAAYRASMLALLEFDQRPALKDIKVPTLLLSGSKDKNAPAPMMAKMASFISSATYVEIEGAGHLVNLERPIQFNTALDQFLTARVAPTDVRT
ncbi:MAG: alpha/beta fold hydrolase [Bradyrhizobium sp.]